MLPTKLSKVNQDLKASYTIRNKDENSKWMPCADATNNMLNIAKSNDLNPDDAFL